MMKSFSFVLFFLGAFSFAQNFTIIPLGVRGGSDESNLSSYLISENGKEDFLALDAGTLYSGIHHYLTKNGKSDKNPSDFLRNKIKGYFISHPHFDHTSGLIINSAEDSPKKIYGSEYTLKALKNHVFIWETWANFTDEGEKPTLNKYSYQLLETGKWYPVEHTDLDIQLFELSHTGNGKSSAVLVKNSKSAYFLYLGDTGADSVEKSDLLQKLWASISPLIKNHQLKGIAIECSYTNDQPNQNLYGHLKPELLINEMESLMEISGKQQLKDFTLIITHIKPKKGIEEKIKTELKPLQSKMNIVVADQGKPIKI